MAKISFGAGVADIRGSIGGTTFSKNRYGAYAKNKVSPVQPRTVAQMAQRESTRAITNLWTTLSEDIVLAWNKSKVILRDWEGKPYEVSGIALFMLVNRTKQTAGETYLTTVPANFQIPNIPTLIRIEMSAASAPPSPTSRTLAVYFTPSPLPLGLKIFVRATFPMGMGRNFFGITESRIIAVSPASPTSPLIMDYNYAAKFGGLTDALIDKVKIGWVIQAYNPANGILSEGAKGLIRYGNDVQIYPMPTEILP